MTSVRANFSAQDLERAAAGCLTDGRGRDAMSAACILLALSAVMGLVLGTLTRWPAIIACDVFLAGLFSMVLQIEGFRTIAGIAIVTVCLTISQVAYLIGL